MVVAGFLAAGTAAPRGGAVGTFGVAAVLDFGYVGTRYGAVFSGVLAGLDGLLSAGDGDQ